jgi:hypothetical protein
LGGGALQLARLAGFDVVSSAAEILKDSRALNLLLENAERCFDPIAFRELNFHHDAPGGAPCSAPSLEKTEAEPDSNRLSAPLQKDAAPKRGVRVTDRP